MDGASFTVNVSEKTGLLSQNEETPDSLSVRYSKWIRIVIVLVFLALAISAIAVRGKASASDCVVLGIVCGTVILVALYPFFTYDFSAHTKNAVERMRGPLSVVASTRGSLVAMVLVLIGMAAITMALPVTDNSSSRLSRAQSIFGLVVFLFLLFLTSNNRSAISWRTVWAGIGLQFLLALFVLRTWAGYHLFKWLSTQISTYLGYSAAGYEFLFGSAPSNFAGSVFPAIIFFCATVELLYFFGILQAVIRKFAVFFLYVLGTSGAESVVAAASPFIGQGENALLVRPFVKGMTKSEIHQIMASGFATISGSVLFGYISLGVSPQYLITAAIMSVPCAIALSKIRYPETEESATQGEVKLIPQDERHRANNPLQALGNGAKTGIKIVLIIAASLIAVLSLLAAINASLTWFGDFFNIDHLTLQKILSYPLYPVAWMMGVEWRDVPTTSELLALKLAANEFAAYELFVTLKGTLTARTQIIITYALCGFANFSSIGIQVGILGAIAPTRLHDFASLALSAMLTGALSTCFGAVTAGMLF